MLAPNGRINEQIFQIAVVAFGPGRAVEEIVNESHNPAFAFCHRAIHGFDRMEKTLPGELRDGVRDVDAVKRLVAFPQRQPRGKVSFSCGLEGNFREVNVGFLALHAYSLLLETGWLCVMIGGVLVPKK